MSRAVRRDVGAATVVWGPGALAAARDLLAHDHTLLSTGRAIAMEPLLAAGATEVVPVPPGRVEDVAAGLRAEVGGRHLVAFGGGRVIDVAKALVAADPPRTLVAIPTTLSGAEMTRLPRHARGVDSAAPRARPNAVVNDPELSASAPDDLLAASSANAAGHALTALCADDATADIRANASAALRLIAGAWTREQPDRQALALAAMLAGAAIARTGLGLHHVLAQTAARTLGMGHAQANAAVLGASASALAARRPDLFAALAEATAVDPLTLAAVLRGRAQVTGAELRDASPEEFTALVAAALTRPEAARTTPAPDRAETEALYRRAGRLG